MRRRSEAAAKAASSTPCWRTFMVHVEMLLKPIMSARTIRISREDDRVNGVLIKERHAGVEHADEQLVGGDQAASRCWRCATAEDVRR